jgi:hypothetical protein
MNTLSIQRRHPSIETRTPASISTPVKAGPVNWLPWTPFCLSSRASRAPRSRGADDRVADQLQGDTPGGQRRLMAIHLHPQRFEGFAG